MWSDYLTIAIIVLGVLLGYLYADTNAATKHRMRTQQSQPQPQQQQAPRESAKPNRPPHVTTFKVVLVGKGTESDAAVLRRARQNLAVWTDDADTAHWALDMIATSGPIRLDVWNVPDLGECPVGLLADVRGAVVLDDERLRNDVVDLCRSIQQELSEGGPPTGAAVQVVATEQAEHLDGDSFVVLGRMLVDAHEALQEAEQEQESNLQKDKDL